MNEAAGGAYISAVVLLQPQARLNMNACMNLLAPASTTTNAGKESLTTLSEKVDLKGQRVFVRVDFNGAWMWHLDSEIIRGSSMPRLRSRTDAQGGTAATWGI
jgi:hypothetical protein